MDTLCSAGTERSGKGKAGLAQAESDAKRATVILQSAANRRFQSGFLSGMIQNPMISSYSKGSSHCENIKCHHD